MSMFQTTLEQTGVYWQPYRQRVLYAVTIISRLKSITPINDGRKHFSLGKKYRSTESAYQQSADHRSVRGMRNRYRLQWHVGVESAVKLFEPSPHPTLMKLNPFTPGSNLVPVLNRYSQYSFVIYRRICVYLQKVLTLQQMRQQLIVFNVSILACDALLLFVILINGWGDVNTEMLI